MCGAAAESTDLLKEHRDPILYSWADLMAGTALKQQSFSEGAVVPPGAPSILHLHTYANPTPVLMFAERPSESLASS